MLSVCDKTQGSYDEKRRNSALRGKMLHLIMCNLEVSLWKCLSCDRAESQRLRGRFLPDDNKHLHLCTDVKSIENVCVCSLLEPNWISTLLKILNVITLYISNSVEGIMTENVWNNLKLKLIKLKCSTFQNRTDSSLCAGVDWITETSREFLSMQI